jgi:hypothetical protein
MHHDYDSALHVLGPWAEGAALLYPEGVALEHAHRMNGIHVAQNQNRPLVATGRIEACFYVCPRACGSVKYRARAKGLEPNSERLRELV